jgi:hypothetical protein
MITDEKIFERLMNGENIDDIMAEITNSVNTAIQRKADADKAAEEAKRKAEEAARLEAEKLKEAQARTDAKREAIDGLVEAVANICELWGWDDLADKCDEITTEEVDEIIEAIDSYGEMMRAYANLTKLSFPLGGTKPTVKKVEVGKNPTVEVKTAKALDASDAINRFLKGYGLI